MRGSFVILRTFLILGLMLISAGSFAQEATDDGEETYNPQIHDGGEGMPCDDPRTVGEANRSQEEEACWMAYGRAVEDDIRRQHEDSERFIREHDDSMRRAQQRPFVVAPRESRTDIGTAPRREHRNNRYGGRENETRDQTYCRYLNSLSDSSQKRDLLVHHNCLR